MGIRPCRCRRATGGRLNAPAQPRLEIGDGRHLAALHWRREHATPVIALHGWLDNAATWSRLAPRLPRYDLCAPDLAGHGRSGPRPPGAAYHFVDNVADVIRAADNLGWERFGLLGHSLGASIATLIAGTVPERISRLICIEGFGPLTTPAGDAPTQLGKAIARQVRPVREVRRFASIEAAIEVRAGATGLSRAAAAPLCERGTHEENGRIVWSSDPRLRHPSPLRLTEPQVLAFIARIAAPTLLVRASAGLDYPDDGYARRTAACRHLKVSTISGNHHLHLEPDTVAGVAAEIETFESGLQL